MVTLASLLLLLQVGFHFSLIIEGRAIHALKHLVLFAAAPIRAGKGGKLEGLDLAGGGQVRAGAQIHKVALTIEGNRRILRQIVDQLYLVGFVLFLHQGNSLCTGQFKAFNAVVALDDVGHFLFYFAQEIVGKGLLSVEIVVEAVIDSRADGQLDIGAQLLNGLGQHMGSRVAQHALGIVVRKGQKFHFAVMIQCAPHFHNLAVHTGAERVLFQLLADLTGDIQQGQAVFKFSLFTLQSKQHAFHPPCK